MTPYPLTITGSGFIAGNGNSRDAVCAATRAGLNNFRESRYVDGCGGWLVTSEAMLDQPTTGIRRSASMAAGVILETFDNDPSLVPEKTPVVLCLAERDRPGRAADFDDSVFLALQNELPFTLERSSMTVSQGRVGSAVALREARRLIYDENNKAVVIACVDSIFGADAVSAGLRSRRFITSLNSDGYIPGEAASAIIVRRPVASPDRQLVLVGLGFGVEKAPIQSELPLRANGLAAAIRNAVEDTGYSFDRLDFRVTDLSGEQYYFREATLALARLARAPKEEFDLWHPADCIGEVGAAIGGAAVNIVWHSLENEYAPGTTVLAHFSNDDGKRAAMIMTYAVVEAPHGQ